MGEVGVGRRIEGDAEALGRIDVAVGAVVDHLRRQADQLVVAPDAVALDLRDLAAHPDLEAPLRIEDLVDAEQQGHRLAVIGVEDLVDRGGVGDGVLLLHQPVGLAEVGLETVAEIGRDGALADMVDLGRQLEALGLAEQVAVHPVAVDREAALGLVARAEADGARRPVGQLDVDRQLAALVERLGLLDAHRVERAERGQPVAQRVDLGRRVEVALLVGHALLQVGGVDLLGAGEADAAHARGRA